MNETPSELVSVIIPAFNAQGTLRRAVASVLAQTHEDFEVLIVNDGSTDATGAVADELAGEDDRVRVIHKENGGPSHARNVGLSASRGQFIQFLDADDVILPHKFEVQIRALRDDPGAAAVYSQCASVDDFSGELYPATKGEAPLPLLDTLSYRNWFANMTPLLRRELVEQVGSFDNALRGGEDYDYWIRCAKVGRFIYLPGEVGRYHLHPDQSHRMPGVISSAQPILAQKHFGNDGVRRRRFLSYMHLETAKSNKADGDWLRCAANLARFAVNARSIREARFVLRLSKSD